MGNILPEHLFNDNTIIKTLNDPSSLYRIILKKGIFFKSEIQFMCGYYSTTTALPTITSTQCPTTFWTTTSVTTNELKTMKSQSSKLMSTTPAFWTPTTMTKTVVDKTVNPTEIAKNADPLHRQTTKCDEYEGSIAVLGTIVGVSLIANVIFSILLFRR